MSVIIPETTLPLDTDLGFSYEYAIDINLGTDDAPVWQRIRFISDVNPQVESVNQDGQTYEDRGAPHPIKVSESWNLSYAQQLHYTQAGELVIEQAALQQLTMPNVTGAAASAQFRWYDWPDPAERKPDPNEAFMGNATVSIARARTGASGEVAAWNVTLSGQGRRLKIDHPMIEVTP